MPDTNKKAEDSMVKNVESGVKATETLISLLAKLFSAVKPDFKGCAKELQEVCYKLLEANKNVVRWINKFRDFDLTDAKYKKKFEALAAEYKELTTGKGYQSLKFDCGEIASIYHSKIGSNKLKKLFAGDKKELAARTFEELSKADAALVEYVHKTIFTSLDEVCTSMDAGIRTNDLKAAEIAQMKFKVDSAGMHSRLQDIGNGLTDLVLKFNGLAIGKSKG